MAKIFRIYDHKETLGCVVAISKEVALGYAIGKYGSGANVERVATQNALDSSGLCILVATEVRSVSGYSNSIRVIE